MIRLFEHNKDFLLTNFELIGMENFGWSNIDSVTKIFGYVFLNGYHIQNEEINHNEYKWIEDNNIDASGIFCALDFSSDKVNMSIDPLCQFNLFYYISEHGFSVSSSLDMIRDFHGLKEVDEEYLFDQLAYQSPMRSKTILKNVHFISFDDLYHQDNKHIKFLMKYIKITIPQYNKYDNLDYPDLLVLYRDRLCSRSSIIKEKFDEIHLQLTGGADSRLALSAFLGTDKLRCYVYGGGTSQNRLIFEELLSSLKIKAVDKILTVGRPLTNSALLFQAISDFNYLKSNNISTYMNGDINSDLSVCKITGYYGANVSGGVGFPPDNTTANKRLEKIPSYLFTYHNYVNDYRERHKHLRSAALADKFYINNRGKAHYAAHSIADNKKIISVDILYDFINLLLVDKCPYSENDINKCAISIDLIYLSHPQLAMFPYDDRKIPMYRNFDNIPLINCFDGYSFSHKNLESLTIDYPKLNNIEAKDYFGSEKKIENLTCLFNHNLIRDELKNYSFLDYLTEEKGIQSEIFMNFLLGKIKMNKF